MAQLKFCHANGNLEHSHMGRIGECRCGVGNGLAEYLLAVKCHPENAGSAARHASDMDIKRAMSNSCRGYGQQLDRSRNSVTWTVRPMLQERARGLTGLVLGKGADPRPGVLDVFTHRLGQCRTVPPCQCFHHLCVLG